MGIRGLAHYMRLSSYLEDYELQNTDLIIDGSNLYNELLMYSDWLPAFGGNYDAFDRTVSDFFDCLLECNVKPLVLFHGCSTESQVPNSLIRLKQRIDISLNMTPESPKNEQGHCLLLKLVFIQCLKEKDIPMAQCQFEGDKSIAAIAKALNCPLVANASYYYLYDALYIPSETLLNNVMNHLNKNRKMIPCKIYRIKRLLNSFEGLNHQTLSLIEVLLSNNYKKLDPMVRNTVALIKDVAKCEEEFPASTLITPTLNWLCKYSLEDTIAEIIKGAPLPMRPELLKIIETYINKYTNPFSEPFTHLMIPEECFSIPTKELYRFKGNIKTLPYRTVHRNEDLTVVKYGDYIKEMSNTLLNEAEHHRDSVIKLPQWFKHQYSLVNFPEYSMSVVEYHYYFYPSLLEDVSRPPSCEIATRLFHLIFRLFLLTMDIKNRSLRMNVIKRFGKGFKMYNYDLAMNLPENIPVRESSPSNSKELINIALDIDTRFIDEFLPEWQLYIACLKYWRTHELSICDKFHMYSMLTCFIYKLTTSKIDYYNSLSTFEKANSSVIKLLQKQRDKSNIERKYSTTVTVAEACTEIDTLDCLLAAPFFIYHSRVNPSLSYGNHFKRHIVYGFSQFQCVLFASIDLNAVLMKPYKEPKIANLYNGTLLYNLYANFQSCEDIETYKNNIFKNSPSLLRAFNVLYKFLKENKMM